MANTLVSSSNVPNWFTGDKNARYAYGYLSPVIKQMLEQITDISMKRKVFFCIYRMSPREQQELQNLIESRKITSLGEFVCSDNWRDNIPRKRPLPPSPQNQQPRKSLSDEELQGVMKTLKDINPDKQTWVRSSTKPQQLASREAQPSVQQPTKGLFGNLFSEQSPVKTLQTKLRQSFGKLRESQAESDIESPVPTTAPEPATAPEPMAPSAVAVIQQQSEQAAIQKAPEIILNCAKEIVRINNELLKLKEHPLYSKDKIHKAIYSHLSFNDNWDFSQSYRYTQDGVSDMALNLLNKYVLYNEKPQESGAAISEVAAQCKNILQGLNPTIAKMKEMQQKKPFSFFKGA
jgi:hypothetical protein